MRKVLFALLTVYTLQVTAQGRCCMSYMDYQADKWVDLPTVKIWKNSPSKQLWKGGFDYQFSTNDKAMDKRLSKEMFAIQYSDTLYINLRNLRCDKIRFGKGLALGLPLVGNKILFMTRRVDKKARIRETTSYMFFGIMGSMISTQSHIENHACYILDSDGNGKRTDVLLVGDDVMRKLLAGKDELLERYFKEKNRMERESAKNILPLLREAGFL